MISSLQKLISSKKYLIFDFDGVILDTVEIKKDAFANLYEIYGEEFVIIVKAFHQKNGGLSRYAKFKHFHKALFNKTISRNELNELDIKFSKLIFEDIIDSVEIEGAFDFINYQIDKDKICLINSAVPEHELKEIINRRNLSGIFRGVFGSPSNKIENFEKIMRESNCDCREMIFFGDAIEDLSAAKKIGIDFIGVGDRDKIFSKHEDKPLYVDDFRVLL